MDSPLLHATVVTVADAVSTDADVTMCAEGCAVANAGDSAPADASKLQQSHFSQAWLYDSAGDERRRRLSTIHAAPSGDDGVPVAELVQESAELKDEVVPDSGTGCRGQAQEGDEDAKLVDTRDMKGTRASAVAGPLASSEARDLGSAASSMTPWLAARTSDRRAPRPRTETENPKALALHRCGLARQRLGDARGAYEDFREAARLEPRSIEIWQSYEEAYRVVEAEIAKEQGWASVGMLSGGVAQDEPGQQKAPPPFFSFYGTHGSGIDGSDSEGGFDSEVAKRESAEMASRAAATEARFGAGAGGLGAGDHSGDRRADSIAGGQGASGPPRKVTDLRAALATRSSFHIEDRSHRPTAHSPCTPRPRMRTATTATGAASAAAMPAESGPSWRLLLGVLPSWLVTYTMVILHYRVNRKLISNITAAAWLLLAPLFLWSLWQVDRRYPLNRLSLSDAIKILCCIVIVGSIVANHYASAPSGIDKGWKQ